MSAASTHSVPDWIAVDWGTSSLRVWAMSDDGSVLDQGASDKGMGSISRADYEPALLALVGDWIAGAGRPVPVIVCGMAGARQGWKEAVYRPVPCGPISGDALTEVETTDPRLSVRIVPGLSQSHPQDVIRGEETQLAGFLAETGREDAVLCLPGTHSKWVSLEGGDVSHFLTVMTGELFSLIGNHSILRHSVGDGSRGEAGPAFLEAVSRAVTRPQNLTTNLFSIRARSLLEEATAEDASDMLSGLLIGTELAACRPFWEGRDVHLVGTGGLAARYAAALKQIGATAIVEDGSGLTLAGLKQVRAGLKEPK